MGDLESGFEEMQGVKLGYLVIKGKQMFPLSQVFTDLLKNIPRTTVHKRMDHLNVKKHHCDLEELRKLKAINSIAFHAAKCTLISREDVEALYFSCKTERVLKSNKRKLKIKPAEDIRLGKVHEDPDDGFWKEKVWLSLHSVPQTFSYQSRAGRQETVSRTDSNLPQIYSKKHRQNFETFTKPTCKTIKNYEKTQKRSNFVAFNQTHSFIRNAVNLQPALCQSAIAAQPKLACSSDLLHKRKRKRQSTGWQFCSRSKPSHQLLFVPKCCKSKVYNSSFNLDHDLYLNQQPSGIFQESCSSDTESSSLSERVNDDSDFGSSLSTTSISGTSDEEDDESFSESSGSSSDEESSSQSDSSSVSSQVSMQSIRFRRARFTSLNSKTPLLLQPTFHYNLQERPGTNGGLSTSKDICEKKSLCGTTKFRDNRGGVALISSKFSTSATENPYIVSKGEEVTIKPGSFKFPDDPKTENLAGNRPKDRGLSCLDENKAFPQQRTSGHTNKCPEALISHCAQDNETVVSVSSNTNLLPSFHLKREIENGHCLKQQTPSKPIKTEPGEPFSASNSCNDVNSSVLTFNNVKIKLENTTDEYELATLNNGLLTKGNEPELQSQESTELKHIRSSSTLSGCNEGIAVHSKVSGNEGIHRTLKAPFPKIGEFRNGARVRKNYRTLALGCKSGNPRIPTRVYAKVDRSSLSVTNVDSKERPNESGMGMTKRKRVSSSGAAGKNTFNFMANFPFPPSLVLGSDGDLAPAYSLNCYRNNGLPHKSHPVWTWQLGGPVVPPPPSQRFRKC